MKNKIFLFLALSAMLSLTSCDLGKDPEIEGTAVQEMAGEWWTTFTVGGEDVYGLGYQQITTSNTASNTANEFLLTDHAHTWSYTAKVPINYAAKTFSGGNLSNYDYDITMNITDGVILPGAATSSGGNVTDSIYFKVEFSDDPGTIYEVAGYRRTGFLEDEH